MTDGVEPPQNGRKSGAKPGAQTLKRLRKAQRDPQQPAEDQDLMHLSLELQPETQGHGAPQAGLGPDAGFQCFTPEQKGKQKAVEAPGGQEEAGPSGRHGAFTPEQAAEQRNAERSLPASLAPAGASSEADGLRPSGQAPKKKRLQKAGGQVIKVRQQSTYHACNGV